MRYIKIVFGTVRDNPYIPSTPIWEFWFTATAGLVAIPGTEEYKKELDSLIERYKKRCPAKSKLFLTTPTEEEIERLIKPTKPNDISLAVLELDDARV